MKLEFDPPSWNGCLALMLLSVGAGETYASKMAQLTISGAMGLELVDIASMIGLFGLPCDFVFTSRALNS